MGITFNPLGPPFDFTGSGGGGGTPGGSDTDVQFNDAGAFGGQSGFTFDKASTALTVGTIVIGPGAAVTTAAGLMSFEAFQVANQLDSALLLSGDASVPVGVIVSETWNDGTLVFSAIKTFITDAASDPSSKLLDLGVGTFPTATTQFSVDKSGNVVAVGSVTASDFIMAGSSLKTDTTNAHTGLIQAYDVDDAVYRTFGTLTNGNTPSFALTAPVGGSLTGNFSTLQIASANVLYSGGPLGTPSSGTLTNATGLLAGGLTLTDTTTNNVSATAHGFAPKFPNNTTTFLRGDGTYAAPTSSGVTSIATTSPISGGTITSTGTLSLLVNVDFAFTAAQSITVAAGAAIADGLVLENTTAATSGNQKWSPALRLTGNYWSGSASLPVDWSIYNTPVQGGDSLLKFGVQFNGAGYTTVLTMQANPGFPISTFVGRLTGDQVISNSLMACTGTLTINGGGNTLQWAGGGGSIALGNAGAGVLEQFFGSQAQAYHLYNTGTLTAGEYFKIDWQGTANQLRFGAVAGSSSGTARVVSWDYGAKLASATAAITVPITSGNIVFGGGVQLSNAAVTGLTPGVLSATTNASIVLYDSGGQAYRVPCII